MIQQANRGLTHPDVVVIGGGPSGATVATLVAQQGHSVNGKTPRVGLEPTTYRLTAGRSTIELSGIVRISSPLE